MVRGLLLFGVSLDRKGNLNGALPGTWSTHSSKLQKAGFVDTKGIQAESNLGASQDSGREPTPVQLPPVTENV